VKRRAAPALAVIGLASVAVDLAVLARRLPRSQAARVRRLSAQALQLAHEIEVELAVRRRS
jgi:hypothetical protein